MSKKIKIILYLIIICLISGSLFGAFYLIKKSLSSSPFKLSQPSQYNQPLTISFSGFNFVISPVNAQSVQLIKENNNRIKYIDAFLNTDVVQTRQTNKLKEEIILKKPGHPEKFAYRINLEEFDYETDNQGNLHFYPEGKKDQPLERLFTIPAPFMIDADGQKSSHRDVEMRIEDDILILKPHQDWLAQVKYPVILDPTVEIHILNVQSYPEVGGEWSVGFTTLGQADLIIEGLENTIFGQDIEFKSLKCGQENRTPTKTGNSYIYKNWSCNQEASFISQVLKPGKHYLRFSFGGKQLEAHNQTGVWAFILANDTPEAWRKKEGDIVAVRPGDWQWGRKERQQYLIVLIDFEDIFENQADIRKFEVPLFETGEVWYPSDDEEQPKKIAANRYQIKFNKIDSEAKKQGITIDWDKVKDESIDYQPLLDNGIVFSYQDLIHCKFIKKELKAADLDIIKKAGKTKDAKKQLD